MSTPPLFKFYLQDKTGFYLTLDSAGNLIKQAAKVRILTTPANWEQISLKIGRNEKYYGTFRKASVQLEFIKDGAEILRQYFYESNFPNFDQYCKLTIEKRDPNNWALYNVWYAAEINFASGMEDGSIEQGSKFKVELLERGLPQIIENKLNTPYEIPLGADAKMVEIQGITLESKYNWIVYEWEKLDAGLPYGFYFPVAYVNNDSSFEVGNGYQKLPEEDNQLPEDAGYFKVSENFSGTLNFTGIRVGYYNDIANSGDINFRLLLYIYRPSINNYIVSAHSLFTDSPLAPNASRELNFNAQYAFDFEEGDVVILTGQILGGGSGSPIADIFVRGGEADMIAQFTRPNTTVPCYDYYTLASKLVNLITGGAYSLYSPFLGEAVSPSLLTKDGRFNNSPTYTYVTSGTAIRGFDNPVIKITLADLLQDCWARWMCGMSTFADNVHINKISAFFVNTEIYYIDSISNRRSYTATEWIYSQMKVGYQDQQLDKINGKYEVNSEQTYKLPITSISTTMDLVSPFNASPYAVEYIRTEDNAAQNTERDSDNDVFLLEAISPNNTLITYNSTQVTGVYPAGIHYNIGLSPHRFVMRHLPYIKSILNSGSISFQSALKNADMITHISGQTIDENDTVYLTSQPDGSTPQAIFKPLIYEFECMPRDPLLAAILSNPYGYIRFNDNGTDKKGFILDVEVIPSELDTYKLKLLATADNVVN